MLSVCPTYQLMADGAVREITSRVQRLRKMMHLTTSDKVDICYQLKPIEYVGCSDELVQIVYNTLNGNYFKPQFQLTNIFEMWNMN